MRQTLPGARPVQHATIMKREKRVHAKGSQRAVKTQRQTAPAPAQNNPSAFIDLEAEVHSTMSLLILTAQEAAEQFEEMEGIWSKHAAGLNVLAVSQAKQLYLAFEAAVALYAEKLQGGAR
jgi:hypothetical protein